MRSWLLRARERLKGNNGKTVALSLKNVGQETKAQRCTMAVGIPARRGEDMRGFSEAVDASERNAATRFAGTKERGLSTNCGEV